MTDVPYQPLIEPRLSPSAAPDAPQRAGLYAWWRGPGARDAGLELIDRESSPLFVGCVPDLHLAIGADISNGRRSPFRQRLGLHLSDGGAFNPTLFIRGRGRLTRAREEFLTTWIREHLLLSWCPLTEPEDYYAALLTAMDPPLNGNAQPRPGRRAPTARITRFR